MQPLAQCALSLKPPDARLLIRSIVCGTGRKAGTGRLAGASGGGTRHACEPGAGRGAAVLAHAVVRLLPPSRQECGRGACGLHLPHITCITCTFNTSRGLWAYTGRPFLCRKSRWMRWLAPTSATAGACLMN
eukprot:930476-Prorocentrum_minimum.AAC.1